MVYNRNLVVTNAISISCRDYCVAFWNFGKIDRFYSDVGQFSIVSCYLNCRNVYSYAYLFFAEFYICPKLDSLEYGLNTVLKGTTSGVLMEHWG